MSIVFHGASGSPYVWRVWFALEHKQLSYEMKMLSFSEGDLAKPEFSALNPRRKVPVLVDSGFALYESAAIIEYLEDSYPHSGRSLFPADVKQRAIARRLIREADAYAANSMEIMVEEIFFKPREQWNEETIAKGKKEFVSEMSYWERVIAGSDFLAGTVGAVDFTLYPILALAFRLERPKPDLALRALIGPRLSAWMARMEQLTYFQKTIPPHWKS